MRRSFYSIRCRGLEHLQGIDPNAPVVAFSNHTNWWDGLIVYYLTRFAPHKDFFCMMDETQLQHHRFFRWIGAFSVNLSNPLQAAAAVRYAVRLLQKNSSLVWIFPQGELVSPHIPIKVRSGTNYLATRSPNAQLLAVAFRYEFVREDRPEVFIEILPKLSAKESSDERLEQECLEACSRLDSSLASKELSEFKTILKPKMSINKRWEWIQLALKGRLSEFKAEN